MSQSIRCCQSVVAFFAVISTAFICFVVPILCVLLLLFLAVFSFWPVILAALPFIFLSFSIATFLLCFIGAILYRYFNKETKSFLGSRAFFLLPFHALFIAFIVSIFSFWWSLAVGAVLFVQGEVDFNTLTVNSRWSKCVEQFDRWSWPIFQYFPITLTREQRRLHTTPVKRNTLRRRKRNKGGIKDFDEGHDDVDDSEEDSSDDTKYLFCYHPHGVYALGLFSLVFQKASGFTKLFPNRSGTDGNRGMLVGVASALLHVPILGRLFSWFGFIPASRSSLNAACQTNNDVVIVPGGIAEMTLIQTKGIEKLYLKLRKGYIKLAIQHGRPLVPVYCFGETKIFHQYNIFSRTRQWLSRKLKVSIVFFRGRNCTLVPKKIPLKLVIGEPIYVMQSDSPTDEYVDMIHEKYTSNLIALFDKHKKTHELYMDTQLKIV
jgi:hypothetical protein